MGSEAFRGLLYRGIVVVFLVLAWNVPENGYAQEKKTGAAVQGAVTASVGSNAVEPRFRHGAYGHESIELGNDRIRLVMFRRLNGWAWGELYTPSGKFMAVLEHLGEVMMRDQDIPVRLEADSVYTKTGPEGKSLVFNVKSTVVREKLKGTSFEKWMLYPLEHPCVVGVVTLTVPPDEPVIYMKFRLVCTAN
ncbi:hypothetical protein LLG96_15020 [bacterium]|nr:hypothetical protein [bacterium]